MESKYCIWTYRQKREYEIPCTVGCNSAGIMYRSEMKYCPYCGKPIKVKEKK